MLTTSQLLLFLTHAVVPPSLLQLTSLSFCWSASFNTTSLQKHHQQLLAIKSADSGCNEFSDETDSGILRRPSLGIQKGSHFYGNRNGSGSTCKRLPQAIIVGVKKGGTRALLEYLRVHPGVRAPGPETHFFDRFYERGIDWYRSQMPETTDSQLTLEKTPSYWIRRQVPQRIFKMLGPQTKLLVVVRNPVTRAISDFTQSSTKRRSRRRFEEVAFSDLDSKYVDISWSGIKIGLYAKQLKKWLTFFPLRQFLFVSGEALISDPLSEMKRVERFLGLKPFLTSDHFQFNQTKGFPCIRKKATDRGGFKCLGQTKGRPHPIISENALTALAKFFRPYNDLFFKMVQGDFGWNNGPLL